MMYKRGYLLSFPSLLCLCVPLRASGPHNFALSRFFLFFKASVSRAGTAFVAAGVVSVVVVKLAAEKGARQVQVNHRATMNKNLISYEPNRTEPNRPDIGGNTASGPLSGRTTRHRSRTCMVIPVIHHRHHHNNGIAEMSLLRLHRSNEPHRRRREEPIKAIRANNSTTLTCTMRLLFLSWSMECRLSIVVLDIYSWAAIGPVRPQPKCTTFDCHFTPRSSPCATRSCSFASFATSKETA
jgi:hypothetical protein